MTTHGELEGLLAAGLSQEEASMVLRLRNLEASACGPGLASRLHEARMALSSAERRVGARSISTQGDDVVEVVPPDTSVSFLKKGVSETPGQRVPRQEDVSQDPEDWK